MSPCFDDAVDVVRNHGSAEHMQKIEYSHQVISHVAFFKPINEFLARHAVAGLGFAASLGSISLPAESTESIFSRPGNGLVPLVRLICPEILRKG